MLQDGGFSGCNKIFEASFGIIESFSFKDQLLSFPPQQCEMNPSFRERDYVLPAVICAFQGLGVFKPYLMINIPHLYSLPGTHFSFSSYRM